ncbi:EKC/KEOPS complex subunit TPRKB-like isoform X2 [Tubulanus polymorphus]
MNGEIEVALLNPKMIIDRFQVLCAATKALHLSVNGKMVTRNLHSEIIYNMSPSKNISDAFKKYGSSDKDTSIMFVQICKVNTSMDEISTFLSSVDGIRIGTDLVNQFTDETAIKKMCKIKEKELEVGSLLEAVIGRSASKDIVSL